MEHSIVSDFENLQVLASCDFQKMDRMVQDLTNALEETERPPPRSSENTIMVHTRSGTTTASKKHVSAAKKHRCKKRKSTQNIWGCGNLSEASESSLDEAFRDYMESVPHGSDSDEFVVTVNRLQLLASFANTALSLAESDSFNETISPMRAQAQRRRRKLKRMAIDPHPDAGIYGDKCCHLREKLTHSRRLAVGDAGTDGAHRDTVHGSSDTLPGKRKRGMRDKGENSYEVEREGEEASGGGDDAHMECSNNNERSSSVSSFSSSDSDGIVTNDDARDGDDEQSDFFHENGPACGIPGIIPWWENEGGDAAQRDENFEKILNGVFEYLPAASKRSFNMRLKLLAEPEREIRAGQRRLKDRSPAYSLSCFLQDRQQWSDNSPLFSGARQNGTNSDNKRRRRTPPTTPTEEGFVGGDADPIPETNIGNRLLQSMGWTPGTGLGSKGVGIKNPVMAYRRHGRKGLGARKGFPLPPMS